MAYLQGYSHDIFVSYAHAPQLSDWSKRLCESLGSALDYLLGCKAPQPGIDIWMDPELRGNLPLTEQIQTRVEQSALLLIVMSRFYLASGWCGKEVGWFEAVARSRVAPRSRIFIIHPEPTDRTKWPSALSDLTGYAFHSDPRIARVALPFGLIGNEEDKANFEAARWNVAQQVKLQMDDLLAEVAAPPVIPTTPPAPLPTKPSGGGPKRLIFLDEPTARPAPDAVDQAIRGVLRSSKAEVFDGSIFRTVPRAPDAANQLFAKLVKAKAGCDGLLFVQRTSDSAPGDWLLDFLSEVAPAARQIRPDGDPPMPAVIDATEADGPLVLGDVPVFKYGRPDFAAGLTAWVQGLAQVRGAS